MIIGRFWVQSKRENIHYRIKRSNIFLENQIYELEPCLAISLEITTQFGQEFGLKSRQFKWKFYRLVKISGKSENQFLLGWNCKLCFVCGPLPRVNIRLPTEESFPTLPSRRKIVKILGKFPAVKTIVCQLERKIQGLNLQLIVTTTFVTLLFILLIYRLVFIYVQ